VGSLPHLFMVGRRIAGRRAGFLIVGVAGQEK
jgi:hypothetical protein